MQTGVKFIVSEHGSVGPQLRPRDTSTWLLCCMEQAEGKQHVGHLVSNAVSFVIATVGKSVALFQYCVCF